jgi:hypothetical protein
MDFARTVKRKLRPANEPRIANRNYGTPQMTDEELELERSLTKYLQMQRDIFTICSRHGGSVTGGPRTEARNAAVGGVENSYHLWGRDGMGVDIAFDDRDGRIAATAAFKRMDYEVITYDSHIHVEPIG